jgi:WD40 repeat protein
VVSSRIELSVPNVGGSVAWSPTGVFVATGVDPFALGGPHTDGGVDIRDADTGEIVSSFPGHDGDINVVAFSSDGSAMATAGSDGTVKVWDPSTGALRTSASWRGEVYSVSFSPDGSFLAVATGFDGVPDGMLRILDTASERVRTLRLPPWVNDLAISPDGTRVAAAGGEIPGSVYLIDIATFDVATLRGGRKVQSFTSVSWSPDGRYVAAGGFAPLVKVWDLATGRDFTLDGHTDSAHWVDWGTDPTRLVTGGNDGTARVWEIEPDGARELFSLSGSDGPVSGVTFSPDGTRLMTSIGTRAVEVWDVGPAGDAEIANLPEVFGDVVFDSEGHLLSSERDGSQARLDIGSGTSRPIGSIDLGGKDVVSVDISPDGRLVAHRYEDGTMTVRDVVAGDALFSIEGPVSGISWSPDGGHLAARSDGFVTIVDLDGDVTSVLRQEGVTIQRVWYGPAGLIATIGRQANGDVRLEIWEEGRGEVVVRIRALSGAFTTDSPLLFDYGDELSDVAFDPKGERIATRRGATIEIWDVSSGELIAAMPTLPADIGSMTFSPDGSSMAVGTVDGVVRLFDAATSKQVLLVPGHRAPVERMVFNADGSVLASQDSAGMVLVWALDIDDLLEIARRNVTRSLTDEECRQYLHLETCPR